MVINTALNDWDPSSLITPTTLSGSSFQVFSRKAKVFAIRVFVTIFTCAVKAISKISWFACTIVRAFSVVTESIGVAVMLSCLTLVYVCKIVKRMH